MSRPKPNVLMTTLERDDLALDVCECDAVYAIYYQNKPIKIRTRSPYGEWPKPKYGKSSFPEPGHAFNLAEKLNEKFETNEFYVVRLEGGIEYKV